MKCYHMLQFLASSHAVVCCDGSVIVSSGEIGPSRMERCGKHWLVVCRHVITVLSVQTRYTVAKDSVVQFFFYQPISHQWRQTDFFPCTVTCGGGETQTLCMLRAQTRNDTLVFFEADLTIGVVTGDV